MANETLDDVLKRLQLTEEEKKKIKESVEAAKEANRARQEALDLETKILESLNKQVGIFGDINGNYSVTVKKFQETKELFQENEKILKEIVEKINEQGPELEQQIKLEKEKLENLKLTKSLNSDEVIAQQNIVNNLAIKKKGLEQELEKHLAIQKALALQRKAQEEISRVAQSFSSDIMNSQIAKTFTLTGIYERMKGFFNEILDANQQFAATTGQIGRDLINQENVASLAAYGAGYGKLMAASSQLMGNMSAFSNLNVKVQNDLANTAVKMELLGVSAAEQGQLFNLLNKSLNVAAEDTGKTMEEMAKVAQGIGVAPAKLIKDFSAVMPNLAANGKKAKDIFYDLAKQSKALGVEISSLTSLAEGFDTFEGAAEKSGKLNSILGGNFLNSMELVQATEEERIEIIKRGFDLSGRQFADMDRATQKSIAQSLGFKSAAEAAAVLGTSTEDMRLEQMKGAKTQEDLEKVQKEAAKVSDQLTQSFNQMMIALAPLVNWIKDAVTWFNELSSTKRNVILGFTIAIPLLIAFSSTVVNLIGTVGNIRNAIKNFGRETEQLPVKSMEEKLASVGEGVKKAGKGIGQALRDIGKGAKQGGKDAAKGAWGFIALGAAALMIGGGIAIAAEGLAKLAASFSGLGDAAWPAAAAIIGFTVAFGLLMLGLMALVTGPQAVVAAGAVGLLLAVGAAALMVGLGIYLATSGMANFVTSLIGLAKEGPKVKDALSAIGDAAGSLVGNLKIVTDSNIGDALRAVNKNISGINSNMKNVLTDMRELGTIFTQIATPVQTMSTAFNTLNIAVIALSGNMATLVSTMSSFPALKTAAIAATVRYVSNSFDIPQERSIAIKQAMDSVKVLMETTNKAQPEKLATAPEVVSEKVFSLKEVITNVINSQKAKAENSDLSKLIMLLAGKTTSTVESGKKEMTQNIVVKVLLDSKEISSKISIASETAANLLSGGTLNPTKGNSF